MNHPDTRPVLMGYLFAIGATVFWSGNFVVARELNQSVPPVTLAFWRWLVAAGVITLITRGVLDNLLSLSFASGDVWMLTASFGFAIYSILVIRKPTEIGVLHLISGVMIVSGILIANRDRKKLTQG